ncbi:hypothetical protein GOBAR_DD16543 [Gossypium barbadense]|nr:hypothetical protein GOBAR_DD16543 [Gossypium barbadense]
MDSRDSSSSPAPNRDSSAGEDDGVLPVTAALAKEAALHFQSRNFSECVDVLDQLKVKKEGDPKVLHNIAIAEIFRDGCSDPKKLLEVLNDVKKRSEELVHASREQAESGSNGGNKFTSGSKGSGTTIQQFSSSDSASVIYTVESDASVAALNIAVIWFHLHEYSKALSVLEPLQQPFISAYCCWMLLLACRDASKAASISGVDLKLMLQLYKVRFLLLTRNVKLAKREVKHAMNIARGRDSSMALLLKAQLEYARGNHRKAIKLLMASSNRTDAATSSMLNNNLGCIYYKLGKYHTSAVFFSKALSVCSSLRKEKPLKLLTFSQDKSLFITYNCGLQYLACGKPILAARCFQKASSIFYKRPHLWLRLAECCLMAVEKGLVKGNQTPSDKSEIRANVIGKGRWRKLLIEYGVSRNGHVDSVEKNGWALGGDVQPKLSLSLARQCLYNALHLLNRSEWSNSKSVLPSNSSVEKSESRDGASSKNLIHKKLPVIESRASTMLVGLVNSNGDLKESKGGANQEIVQNSISYYEDIHRRENQMIKQALLANLAYVELPIPQNFKT